MLGTSPFWPSAMFTAFTIPAAVIAIRTAYIAAGSGVGWKLPQFNDWAINPGVTVIATPRNTNSARMRLNGLVLV